MVRNPVREAGERPLSGAWLAAAALAATAVYAALAYIVVGQPALIGIDDAAITRNYAENIANGHGFVYYVGGERVEGATSFLWTLVVALAYVVTPTPELLIVGICGSLTTLAVFSLLSFTALAARRLDLPQRPAVGFALVGLAGLPGYFFWTVFTMMEVALWSAVILLLVWRLARLVERPQRWCLWVAVAAALLPLIRPEGSAIALGLLALAVVLMRRLPRGILLAAAATVASTAGIVGFRLAYFGYPFPNTFYAKVSSDRVQDMIEGAKYVFSFVTGFPFAEILLTLWALAAIWALTRRWARERGSGALVVGAATVFGVLGVYGALGGDHFAYWRFLEPIAPLLVAPPALALAALSPAIRGAATPFARVAMAATALALWLGVSYGDYRQARFKLQNEVSLVERGVEFGALLNGFEPKPTLGVGAAGGIALAYDGPILDLLGLNWVAMAHANPVKTGMRNHASFDKDTFWEHAPDLIGEFNRVCEEERFGVRDAADGVTKGLYLDAEFQARFRPVRFLDEGRCWRGFADADWLETADLSRIEVLEWAEVAIVQSLP